VFTPTTGPHLASLARVRARLGHGTRARWTSGCRCSACRQAHADAERSRGRVNAQARLPAKVRERLLEGIYAGTPLRSVVRELGLTSEQVWRLTKTDQEWSTALEAALTAVRLDDLEHGTNAAYVNGCVCTDCREHQQRRMGGKPGDDNGTPLDCDALERWTRVSYERGMRSRKGDGKKIDACDWRPPTGGSASMPPPERNPGPAGRRHLKREAEDGAVLCDQHGAALRPKSGGAQPSG
jgi:hypothetical protein